MSIVFNGVIAIATLCLIWVMVDAVAYQEFSWWIIPFCLLFGTIFVGILSLCFLNYRENNFRRSSVRDYPNEPWMWYARWHSASMTSRSKSEFWGTLAFSIILGVFALVGVVTLFEELPEGNLWALLNLISIVGAIYFVRKTHVAWRTLRFEGQVTLTREMYPAWSGATFSALIETKTEYQANYVEVFLEHWKIVRREESDGVAFKKVVDCRLTGQAEYIDGGKIRVSIDIPEKFPATSWSEVEQRRWSDLLILINISGTTISLRYEIPVADPAEHKVL